MASAIAQVGSVIAKNKENTKSILDKYKISYGKGTTVDLIKAVFSTIKSGNKEFTTEISALVKANKKAATATNPLSSGQRVNILEKIKTEIISKIGKKTQSSADGEIDEVNSFASQLFDEIASKDINDSVAEGKSSIGATPMAICVILVIILIAIILWYSYKKIKK